MLLHALSANEFRKHYGILPLKIIPAQHLKCLIHMKIHRLLKQLNFKIVSIQPIFLLPITSIQCMEPEQLTDLFHVNFGPFFNIEFGLKLK